jgi:signal transduction histidine kinase/CheY-like chemotaxis protein/GAF domain-containing protein
MKEILSQSDFAIEALHKATEAFTSFSLNSFEDIMAAGIRPIADAVNADVIVIYNKTAPEQETFGQFYRWDRAAGGTSKLDEFLEILPPIPAVMQWLKIVMNGDCVFRRVDTMDGDEANFSKLINLKSVAIVPIFTQGNFWGAVAFQDHANVRDFDEHKGLLQISARLIACTAIRQGALQEAYETAEKLERKKMLADALCKATSLLIPRLDETFEERMNKGVRLIADAGNLDRISVWRNFTMPDGLHMEQIYRWYRKLGGTTKARDDLKDVAYPENSPFEALFESGGMINGPVKHLPAAAFLQSFGMVSVVFMPLHINNAFFGFVAFEDLSCERYFDEDQVEMMRTAALLLANTVIRNEMEQLISETQDFIKAVIKSNPLTYMQYADNGQLLDCNDVALRVFEASDKKTFIERYWEMASPEFQPDGTCSREKLSQIREKAYNDGKYIFEWMHQTFNHEPLPMEVTLVRLDYEGKTYFLSFKYDLRPIKEYEKKLNATFQELISANRTKDEFLSKLSHEIRTPLNAILGIAEIHLRNETLSRDLKEDLNTVYNSGDLLLRIINDILDLSKIKAGRLEVVPAEYGVASLINDIAHLNMLGIGSKPIEFRLQVDKTIPANLIGDELRIKQVLNNLISNAFKYTKSGEVVLSIAAEYEALDAQSPVMLVCRVSDTGLGMTDKQVEKVFDEYIRFSLEIDRAVAGIGLGLSITRNLVQAMGGEIFVESEPGKGSIFTARLPQLAVDSTTIGPEVAESLCRFRFKNISQARGSNIAYEYMPYASVLIVDDLETNLSVARGLFAPYGLSIDTALSGFEAIDRIKSGRVYDIIFMDYMMPEMDGIETTKKIRDLGYMHPIVAFTADAVVGRVEKYLENGFDGFLSKPVDTRRLDVLLNMMIRDKQSPEILENARQQALISKMAGGFRQKFHPALDPQFVEIFVRDAGKIIAELETVYGKLDAPSVAPGDIRKYTIAAHSMKSALANVGETKLSAVALELEQASRADNIALMKEKTPDFLNSLRMVIARVQIKDDSDVCALLLADEDWVYLYEKLEVVRMACAEYDTKTARDALGELRRKKWPRSIKTSLSSIAEHLLHSDFDEVIDIAGKLTEQPSPNDE